MRITTLDIFCTVIDNFGDIGIVYRFAREFLRHNPGVSIRVFVDDLVTFSQINSSIDSTKTSQTIDNITYINTTTVTEASFASDKPADLLIEAFGCQIPEHIMKRASHESTLLINLEYISAEDWVDGYHCVESLLPEGTLKKYFFMPGFTDATGGVILNSSHPQPSDLSAGNRIRYLNTMLVPYGITLEPDNPGIIGTVFTYTRNFSSLLRAMENHTEKTFLLLVFGAKSKEGFSCTLKASPYEFTPDQTRVVCKNITLQFMPNLAQKQYDDLLYYTDFNIVRGEDSLVRAILAGNPFIWNAYIQKQKYHKVKVEALCRTMEQYFDSSDDFAKYQELMIQFNDIDKEDPSILPVEDYEYFFRNLQIVKHATQKMCYFLQRHCNLIDNISNFIVNYKKT